jgi:hypothetical protein
VPPTLTEAIGVACGDGVGAALDAAAEGKPLADVTVADAAAAGANNKRTPVNAARLRSKERTKRPPPTIEHALHVL